MFGPLCQLTQIIVVNEFGVQPPRVGDQIVHLSVPHGYNMWPLAFISMLLLKP
jgi:hypothetical protein